MTARLPECPRCGYDLQGQIAAWHPAGDTQPDAACPTTGTCSECGLDFEWRFILVEGLASPKWFFETTRSRLVRSVIRTWVHSLSPPKFWRDVRLEVTPRIWRLAIYVVGPVLASVLIHALIFLVIRALWYWVHSTRAARFSVKQYPTPLGELHLAFSDFMHESMAQTACFGNFSGPPSPWR